MNVAASIVAVSLRETDPDHLAERDDYFGRADAIRGDGMPPQQPIARE